MLGRISHQEENYVRLTESRFPRKASCCTTHRSHGTHESTLSRISIGIFGSMNFPQLGRRILELMGPGARDIMLRKHPKSSMPINENTVSTDRLCNINIPDVRAICQDKILSLTDIYRISTAV